VNENTGVANLVTRILEARTSDVVVKCTLASFANTSLMHKAVGRDRPDDGVGCLHKLNNRPRSKVSNYIGT
jgi:hypothetical protein